MPIYEYHCPKCGEFEVTQRITEDPLKKCPTCRSKVRKLISNTSFQLKGSGWYITDYGRKGGGKEKSDSSTESKSESGKAESGKAESSETKADSGTKSESSTKSDSSGSGGGKKKSGTAAKAA